MNNDVHLCLPGTWPTEENESRSAWSAWNAGDDAALLADLEGPTATDSGVYVNHYTALTHNPVWSAVSRIMFDIAKLPLYMYENLDTTKVRGARQLASHPTQRVINRKANALTSGFRFWATFAFHFLLWNKAYAWVERNSVGQCIGLYNLPPDTTYPLLNPETEQYDIFISNLNGREWPILASDVLDVVGPQYDQANVLDITELAKNNWGVGMAGNRFISEFFDNGIATGGIIEVPAETTPKSAENLMSMIEKQNRGLRNAFKYMLLRDGAKYHQTTVRPVDAQMAELLAGNVRDVGRWYRMPPSKLGAEGEGGVYGNREADARDYLDGCLGGWLANIVAQCWLKLLTTDAQKTDRYGFEHDTAALLATETLTTAQVLEIYLRSGLMNPNEGRSMIGLNPRTDPAGEQYYHSNNMQPPAEPGDESDDDQVDTTSTSDDQVDDDQAGAVDDETRAKIWQLESERIANEYRTKAKWHQTRRGTEFRDWWRANWLRVATPYMDALSERARLLGFEDECDAAAAVLSPIARDFNDGQPLNYGES